MNGDELACKQVVEIVTDYLEDAMAPEDRRRFEEHLAACDGCASYLEQLRTTIRLTGRLAEDALPPGVLAPLLAAFRAWRRA